eukprot:GHRQ01025094.1.p2 GENE.GHRQ01025094.1~~GHRQ01025094.1.p2  ORF type:complete len:166 (+),score=42.04 GHRQ01025094.1:1068-1565(+)
MHVFIKLSCCSMSLRIQLIFFPLVTSNNIRRYSTALFSDFGTGIMLLCPGTFNLVVVEGCPKSLKRYHKLMLRRIDWNATPLPQPGEEEDDAADAAEAVAEDKPNNSCHLVWEGEVASASFKDFSKEEVASPEAARKVLAEQGVAHYWDAAANYDFEAGPLAQLP